MDVDRILAIALAWLATFAVHGAVLCAAAAAIGIAIARVPLARMVGRARLAAARERLWKLAIFGGLATATLTTAGAGPWQLRIALERDRPAAGPATGKEVAPGTPVPPAPPPALPSSAPATESSTRVIDPAWLRFAAWIWLAGIASGAAAWTRDRRRIAGQLRGRVRATSGPAREILTELRRRSGGRRDPDLYFAPGLASPISLGIRRPAICIPPQAETDLMRDELEALLAHELAHVERRDPLLLALCRAVEVVLFVQPLLRFARGRLVDEAEVLCDERAAGWTGDPAALASCLAEVATWVVAGRREELVPAMAARGSRLEGRVRGLLDGAASARAGESRRRPVLLPVAWALGLAPCALGVAPLAIGGIGLEAAGIEAPGIETAELGASGLEAEIVGAIPPPAEASPAALAASALELRELLELVENEYAALAADPRLASAPEATRARAAAIGTRIQTLHAASARLDALLAEDSSQER